MSEEGELRNKNHAPVFKITLWILAVIAVVCIATVICNRYFCSMVTVSGSAMEETMHAGEKWLISRIDKDYRIGDIITFYASEDSEKPSVSRVIATGGDSVYIDIRTGMVYVNGEPSDDSYISGNTDTSGKYISEMIESGNYSESDPIIVPSGFVFVMGDNRENSRDSREFGPVSTDLIFGKVIRKLK